MKKTIWLSFILSLTVIMIFCSNKKGLEEESFSDKREVSSEINLELVNSLVGDWIGDVNGNYPGYGKRTITEKNGYIYFKDEKLQICDTIDNVVLTQTDEESPFFYDFKINEEKLTVYPSYPVPKGMVGGSLAPMEFVRDDGAMIDVPDLYGEWQSIEESSNSNLLIEPVSEGLIQYADNVEKKESQTLTIEEMTENSIVALSEDKTSSYMFTFNNKDELTVLVGAYSNDDILKEDIPGGLSVPAKYKRIIN